MDSLTAPLHRLAPPSGVGVGGGRRVRAGGGEGVVWNIQQLKYDKISSKMARVLASPSGHL